MIQFKIKSMKRKYLIISISVLLLIVAGSLLVLELFITTEPDEHSIAVLPFSDFSSGESNTHLSDGMTSETINGLARVNDFKVLSYTSVENFRNSTMSISEMGEALNVKYILEGSVQRNGPSIRVAVQLVDAISGTHLWATTYEYEMNEADAISSIQSRMVQDIAARIEEYNKPR